jgi:hypothetical protein
VPPQEGVLVEVDGLVSGYEGLQQFAVGALTVDAREATIRPAGAELANGLRVEVRGVMSGGVLVAGRVQVRGEGSGNGDGRGNGGGGGGGGNGNGSGSGDGNGNGTGTGTGNGNGNGNGNGDGNGNGSGNESGSGGGTGNGNAPGNGAGNSNGTGNNNNGNGSNNGNGNANNGDRVYKVNGRISHVDGPQGTFVIRKTLLDYRNAAFHGGTAADLAAGTMVQAEGTLSSDGTRLLATSVEFR